MTTLGRALVESAAVSVVGLAILGSLMLMFSQNVGM